MAQPGSVAYLFNQVGRIVVNKDNKNIDDIFLLAADNGAEDVVDKGDEVIIYTNINQLAKIQTGFNSRQAKDYKGGSGI